MNVKIEYKLSILQSLCHKFDEQNHRFLVNKSIYSGYSSDNRVLYFLN